MNPEQEAFAILHDKAGKLFDIETMEARDKETYLVLVHAMQYLLSHYLYKGSKNNPP